MATERVVYDGLQPCSYLPERVARLPLRYPTNGELAPREFDARLAAGDRRSGPFLYRPSCPQCRACEAIRLEVRQFKPSQTQRRVLKKGNEVIRVTLGPPQVDDERVALFNAHRNGRGLAASGVDIDADGYSEFLSQSCCQTFEIQYRLATPNVESQDPPLLGVAICDLGEQDLSAVYCYYDPVYAHLSLGVFSVLTQIEFCRAEGLRYLYLGLYIAESSHMNYKARYLPHERLVSGRWCRFERDKSAEDVVTSS